MHRIIDEAARALAKDPLVYQRAHELVTVVGAPDPAGARAPVSRGAPTIRPLIPGSIIPRLTRHVNFQRFQPPDARAVRKATMEGKQADGQWAECLPPKCSLPASPRLRGLGRR